ncbi:MAG: Crp/Fnr family transcriptional regulator [Chloroflexi bacterium]|nr:Crp/Fnr family transcriptional regulator [Chloroflexota bacterium]
MKPLAQLLAQNPVFASLSAAEREALAAQSSQKLYDKGAIIAYYGDVWPYLLLVEQGSIHAMKESREGRSLIVTALEPGELFWGLAFFEKGAPLPAMLRAQEPCRVWLWSRDLLLPIMWGNGRFSWELSRLMAQRMQRASDVMEELAFQPVRGRLARLLLGHFGDEAVDDFVARDLTLDEMAAHVGTKREMVCRLLYQFADEGVIEISRTEFMIIDRDKLVGFSQQAKG